MKVCEESFAASQNDPFDKFPPSQSCLTYFRIKVLNCPQTSLTQNFYKITFNLKLTKESIKPILHQFCVSIPAENVRKLEVLRGYKNETFAWNNELQWDSVNYGLEGSQFESLYYNHWSQWSLGWTS